MRDVTRLGAAALLAVLALGAGPATAQDRTGTVEITPFGGASFGGRLHAGSNDIFADDVEVTDEGTYGLRVGVNANRWLGLEVGYSRAEAEIRSVGGGSLFGGNSQKLGEMDVEHLEMNALFNMGRRRVIPYFTLGAGVTRFDANVPFVDTDKDTRFTANIGAGLKVFFNPHVALRFDGRARAARVNDTDCDGYWCDDDDDWDYEDDADWYTSGELTVGVTFAF